MLLLVISIQTQENEGKKKSGMGGRQPADPPQTTLNNNAHVSIRVKKKKRGKTKGSGGAAPFHRKHKKCLIFGTRNTPFEKVRLSLFDIQMRCSHHFSN